MNVPKFKIIFLLHHAHENFVKHINICIVNDGKDIEDVTLINIKINKKCLMF